MNNNLCRRLFLKLNVQWVESILIGDWWHALTLLRVQP